MLIDIGLTIDIEVENESIEYLKLEIDRLKKWRPVPRLPQQAPPLPENVKLKADLKVLEETVTKQKQEIEQLQENSFPVMTVKLKAMLKAQNKYWINYDRPELQKIIVGYIKEELGIDYMKQSRTADELAKAIQPDEINR